MADENERLRIQVEELHRRLQAEGSVSGPLRDDLMRLMADVERRLEQPATGAAPAAAASSAPSATPGTLAERLLEAGQRFESTHPVLGTTIGNLADALSRMGI